MASVPIHVPTIPDLFPAIHHVHADRSALDREPRGLWAAAQSAPPSWASAASHAWSRRTASLWPSAAALTGQEAIIPVDRFVAYLEEAERALP